MNIARVLPVTAVIVVSAIVVPPASADAVRELEYWLNDYHYTTAWQTSRGAGVSVAVIDTGINGQVADLRGAVTGGTDPSGIGSPDGQKPVGESSEHGTMVASLLAGRGTGPGNGVIGVAPEANLLSVSVAFGTSSGSKVSNDDQIAAGIRWAVDNGAKVINMSLTRNTPEWPVSWDDAFSYAFSHDVVIVAAAGNRGSGTSEVGAPATIPGVLTVAGVDRAGNASFDASSQGISIGVSAPSEDLVGVTPSGGYVRWSGTSAAAPLVSGLVALVRAAHPDLDAANAINRVIATATARGDEVPSPIYGYGLINPPAAMTAPVTPVTENPMGSLAEWIHLHRRADASAPPTQQAITPIADPPPPRFGERLSLLPTPWTLIYVTLPLALLATFGTLATLLGMAAARHLKRGARKEPRSVSPTHRRVGV